MQVTLLSLEIRLANSLETQQSAVASSCLSKSLRIIVNPIVSVHTFNDL